MIQTKNQSEPYFSKFDPRVIPYQARVLYDIRNTFDYKRGTHEVLLSGSVGSAKSILMAHVVIRHCIENDRARVCLGRKAMPDLKATIYQKILEHMEEDFVEGEDYEKNTVSASIRFANGSEIISRSWSDKKYNKGRSLELSMLCLEELTENNDDDKEAYDELRMRVGRLPHIKNNLIIAATNPDSPSHWVYDHFIKSDKKTRHVYYSVTTDNPFLPSWYIDQLKDDLDPKMARRMIYGEWVEITKDVVYHQYDRDIHYKKDQTWEVKEGFPIHISWDFNIGEGKPLSACLFQFINGHFHFFDEIVIDGMRTQDSCEELAARGLLDYNTVYHIHGDATGRARSTKAIHSDYDIIKRFFSNFENKHKQPIRFEIRVPTSNPPVRMRHNIVNAYLKNDNGDVRISIYGPCKTIDLGLRLTALKKGGQYIEDDSKRFQHITTALGYGVVYNHRKGSTQRITIGER